jgi:hypothetical protein
MIGEVVSAFRRSLGAVLFLCALVPAQALATCPPAVERLCLNGSRFQAEVSWSVPGLGSGQGRAMPLTGDTGAFWFFSAANLELVVKVLDGRPINRHFWVFYGGLSDVEYTLTVTDTRTGVQEVYHNPAGKLASAEDVNAFDEEAPGALSRAALSSAAEALPPTSGPEFQVNATTLGMQWQPAVAMTPGGGFLVVWKSEGEILSRLYDASGAPRTGEIRLGDSEDVFIYEAGPRVAASPWGGFLVIWQHGTRSWVRYVAPDGSLPGAAVPLGLPFRSQALPDVAASPLTGEFLAVWLDGGGQVNRGVLHAQRFDSQGSPVSGEMEIGPQIESPVRLAASPLGGFLVSWSAATAQSSFFSSVLAQRLDLSASPVGTPLEATPAGGVQGNLIQTQPVFYSDGGFSVIWSFSFAAANTSLSARRFLPDGQPAGDAVQIWEGGLPYPQPPLAAFPLVSGGTWLLWSAWGEPDDSDGAVLSGVFDPSWRLQGAVSRVNAFTRAEQSSPAVAGDPAGAVAVWQSGVYPIPIDPVPASYPAQGQDGSYMGVFGQRFTLPTCALEGVQLCLNGRFRVSVQFTDPRSGQTENGRSLPLTGDTGAFWFFDPANVELIVKVLDGRGINGHFWVYAGALSDVAYTLIVHDTVTGRSRIYHNAAHQLASRADTSAF